MAMYHDNPNRSFPQDSRVTRMTIAQARTIAREFIASVTVAQGIQWDITTFRGSMPNGWSLNPCVDDGDLHPLTIANVADVIRQYARRDPEEERP